MSKNMYLCDASGARGLLPEERVKRESGEKPEQTPLLCVP